MKLKTSPDFSIKRDKAEPKSLDNQVAKVASELLNSAVSYHKLHLKVTGTGSFAQHKGLNEIYDSLPDSADDLVEQYQGAAEILITIPDEAPKTLNTVKEGLSHANYLKDMITDLQSKLPYSEIVNSLDETKSTLNSLKYKLIFLS